LLLAAIQRIRSSKFAGNRRAGTRLPVHVPVRLAGLPGELVDLSVTGAGVRIEAPVDLHVGELWLTMELPTGPLELQVEIRRNRMVGRSEVLGLSFAPGQEKAVGELAVAVFHADVATPRRARRRRSTVVWEGPAPETATSSERATAA
jgi:hypothetical protein